MADLYHVQGDTGPAFPLTFANADGTALNLTGYTCTATLRSLESGALVTLALTPRSPQSDAANTGKADASTWTGSEFMALGEYELQGKAVAGSVIVHYPSTGANVPVKVSKALG